MSSFSPGPSAGVYLLETDGHTRLATMPVEPSSVYGEPVVDGYRLWDPFRSKLAVLLLKLGRRRDIGLYPDSSVLYLGAATGTTVSHVSDILQCGIVYAVEFSPRAMLDLLLARSRKNIVPILADAARPELYSALVEPVDMIYQDVAQRNQAEIAARNAQRYLKLGGTLVFMMKTRSIDVTASPKDVCAAEIDGLKGLEVLEILDLLPFHQDHWAVLAKKV
ncbi:MAG: fibrillarin-like rRNA/tRNA 2'-O-methyltransferase [Methanotrichaceae archaeon]|nr:fibrillarin-like rRNA/tRNA 2'-O-methyltransferase [Methanotrichaceae archaeon]